MIPTNRDELLALPMNVLAIGLLQWMNQERGNQFHRNNLTLAEEQRLALHITNADSKTCEAIGEAWDWLKVHGAIAEVPGEQRGWHYITHRGKTLAESSDPVARVEADTRIGGTLHKRINQRVQSQMLLGEYESAVLLAFREVEIRVRELGQFPDSLIGTKLMQEAFKQSGPLTDPNLDSGEQVATMNLFSGAIGAFKNPSSHRQVDYGDITVASEAILLADLLLRILDQYENRITSAGT